MSTIAIAAIGSRGDVAPMTGVGVRLKQAGHRVVIAAFKLFADLITGCGLEFRELPYDFTPGSDHYEGSAAKGLLEFFGPGGMRTKGQALLTALRDEPADLLLLSPLSEFAGHPLAEAMGIPSIGARLQPVSATTAYPPTALGCWTAGGFGNRFASDAAAWAVDHVYGRVVADFRHELGLPKKSTRALRRQRTGARWPVLHGYSPSILPRPADWRAGLDVVGYWWPAPLADWRAPQVLTDFLAAGPAPVCISFGSLITTVRRAEQLSDIVGRALRQAGVRGIVQAGWTGVEVTGDDILTVGEIPHGWLFPQMAAVVHHCGAGTTAAALRAGVPTVAIPNPIYDQPFWARHLQNIGASVATVSQPVLTADRLAQAIRSTVANPQLRTVTQRLANQMDGEDGAAKVLTIVESLVGQAV